MPTVSDNAICIRRWDFSETSQTVLLFCREIGLLRGLAKGAKRPKGAFSGGFDLLTRGQVVAIVRPTADLANITEWHIEQVYARCRSHRRANLACFYMIDLLQHALTERDPHEAVFELFTGLMDAIEERGDPDAALLRWQWGLLSEAGYRPELWRDAETGGTLPAEAHSLGFSSKHGGVVADTQASDRWRVRRETVDLLRALHRGEASSFMPQSPIVDRANRLLAAHWREVLGRQLSTMTALFPDLRDASPARPLPQRRRT